MWNILRKHVESNSSKSNAIQALKPNTTSTNRTSSIIAKTSSIDYEDDDDDDNDDNDDIDPDIHTDNLRSLDVHTILSGCKGWPSDASCVVYHRLEGLICVGTFGGAIFVYGDGFQLMRPWLTDNPVEVGFMAVVYPNKLFVTFSDNSAQLLELPSLTLIALLGSNWISNRNESITAVYVDEPGQLPFAFVGTSEGVVSVLDLSAPSSIRVCDYIISWKTIGLKSPYQVTDIQIYPKDEKYLAISYDSISSSAGHVVIFDLTKQKPYRSYDTNAIVSLAWQHQGDMLFAATKSGKVLSLGVEKTQESSASLWRAAQELVDEDNVYGEEGEEQVCIKKIAWLAPQPPSTEGCLFILLGSKGVDDDDDLKNVIVGLSPNNGNLNDLQLVFALPPLSFEKVLSFDIMPSCERGEASTTPDGGDGDTDHNVPVITPALLLITSKNNDDNGDGDDGDEEKKPLRQLKLVRCPVTDMSQWALEVGTLMDPRPAVEVCSSTSRITFMTGFVPEHSALSLSTALLAKATQHEGSIVQQSITTTTTATTIYDSDEDNVKDNNSGKNTKVSQQVKGKRLSARDFLSVHIQELEEQLNQQADSWEVVLATGVHQDNLHDASTPRLQDIVINGHENGSIIIWGTSLTKRDPSNSAGKGSIWRPLTSLSCGRVGISHISHDETAGLLLAADESGVVVIWSIVGENGSGALSVLQKCKVEAMNEGKMIACEHFQDKYTDNRKSPVDHDDHEDGEGDSTDYDLHKFIDHKSDEAVEVKMKYPLHSSNKFDNLQEIVRTKLNRKITATLLLSSFLQAFIGTEDGKLFTCSNLSSNEFKEIVHAHRPTHFATAGSIISLQFGNFYHTEQVLVPAVYVVYRSGLATVIQLNTLQLIGYSSSHTKLKEEYLSYLRESEEDSCHRDHHHHHRSVDICIANSFYEKLLPPDLLSVNIFLAEDQLTGGSILSTTSPTKQGVGSDTNKDRGTHSSFLSNAFKTTSSFDRSKGDLYGSSDEVPVIKRRMNPRIIPRYLMIVRGKYLFTYDLHKFKRASSHNCLAGYSGKSLSATTVSQKSIVAYKFLSYFKHEKDGDDDDVDDDSDDGHSHESILCVSYVNSDGMHGLFAVKEKAPLGHHNFLDAVLEDHSHLSFGVVLPNGNCYLNDSDRIIYNITTSILNSTYKLNHPLPDRASPDSAAPSRSMMLLSGRESILASKNSLRTRRRSSVIGRISAAAPTDLSLIFRKSMDQRQKDELIGGKGSPSTMEGSDDEDDTFNPSPSSSSGGNRSNLKSSTAKALSTMNETGLALQERGERINRLAHQSDDLREGASQFRDNAKKQKEILKKRSSLFSWG